MAKIGLLYLHDGVWDGQRLLPKGWAKEATQLHVEQVNQLGWGYGYQWWRLDRQGQEVWAGLGFGGQYLFVLPALDMVAVVNAWNLFGQPEKSMLFDFLEGVLAGWR